MAQWKNTGGLDYALWSNHQWNLKQKHKKQPWGNVECFAFGCVTVRFAPLETSFHAANHTLPPPPSCEGHPHCPKDKNRSPFHGEKPNQDVGNYNFNGRDVILHVRLSLDIQFIAPL